MEEWCIGRDKDNLEVYTCNNSQITQLKDPTRLDHAVSVNYLARLLSQMFMDFHNSIFDKTKKHVPMGNDVAKANWISRNIVTPYFINDKTKVLRTPNTYNLNINSLYQ